MCSTDWFKVAILESRHSYGDLMSLKGDYLIATLLYGEVLTVWEDTLVVCMGREKTSLQNHARHKGKGLNEPTVYTSEGESGSTLGICSTGLISRHRALMGLSHPLGCQLR